MMRASAWFLVAAALMALGLSSCSVRNDAPPGTPCSLYQPCPSGLICLNEKCTTACEFVGDCDPDYICLESVCAPRCETRADCDGERCSRSGVADVSFCGDSLSPICASTADCPEGWECVGGGTCVELCDKDADCLPEEACKFYTSIQAGQCDFGERPGYFDRPDVDAGSPNVADPNNIPVDRSCGDKPETYCQNSFGAGQVCYLGECVTAPRALIVLDTSSGAACEPGDGPFAMGGSDLVAVYSQSQNVGWATLTDLVIADGGANREAIRLKTGRVSACVAEIAFSTGCGGWVALETAAPIPDGTTLTVAEYGDTCSDTAADRYRVYLCTDARQVALARDITSCTILVGEGSGERSFVVSY